MKSISKKHLWASLCSWLFYRRKIVLITTGVVVILTISTIAAYLFIFKKQSISNPAPKQKISKVEVAKIYSPLTGKLVDNEAATKQTVTGVMIENSPEARPQSGIKNSGVVFEAIAEGGITRFLVLYQQEKPQMIGPVRSVRMYYIDWAAAFNPGIAHVGGNMDALEEIRNGNYRDLDEFFNAGAYWRSDDRFAPHNMYTSFEKLDALNADKGYTSSTFTGFSRTDGKPSTTPTASNINVTISSPLFNSSYAYDALTNTYARSQAGEAHLDREDGQIAPSVVVAMFVDEQSMSEPETHEQITTIGTGRAVIFQNGTATEATWTKTSKTSQITFTDTSGTDVPLIRGQTWLVALPNGYGDVTWN